MTDEIADEAVKCELCGGKYTITNKAHHIRTKKHCIEEAKKHNEFDYINYKIIDKTNTDNQHHTEKIKHKHIDKHLLKDLREIEKSAREILKQK
jgi:uncharacterized membrane protein YgaE (UPF0421/DUF939 family)